MSKKITKEDCELWLKNNFSKYKLLEWSGDGTKKSKFIDLDRNVEFLIGFVWLKSTLMKHPDWSFGSSLSERVEKTKKTNLAKYGTENVFQNEQIKNKIKEVNIQKYGVANVSQNLLIKEKKKETVLKNYGVEFPSQNKKVREKQLLTSKEKYGVEYPTQSDKVKNKTRKTRIEKGMTKTILGRPLSEWANEKKCNYTTLSRFSSTPNGDELIINHTINKTSIENVIEKILLNLKCDFFYNKVLIKKLRPDFLLNDKKIIIECNGLYWHSDQIIKDKKHHSNKQKEYKSLGYSSLFFNEDEIFNKPNIVESIIKNKLKLNNKIYARKCQIEELQNNSFFEENHLMGKGSGRIYCLKLNNEIVAAMQVKWKNKSENLLEVSRFCTKNNISVVGGFDKLTKYVIEKENPKTIMTFIDKRYGSGQYLENLGWKFDGEHPSFRWVNLDKKQTFHRSLFPGNSGYDKGLAKIWDCGQAKWSFNVRY